MIRSCHYGPFSNEVLLRTSCDAKESWDQLIAQNSGWQILFAIMIKV